MLLLRKGEHDMWIMLTQKPPTTISPPKLSFHWAVPWTHDKYSKPDKEAKAAQKKAEKLYGIKELDRTVRQQRIIDDAEKGPCTYLEPEKCFYDEIHAGKQADWDGALAIFFDDEKIRVFPHEYTSGSSMKEYLEGDALIKHPLSASAHESKNFRGSKKLLVEHALVDGCTQVQADLVAMGLDPFEAEIPPTAWYQMRPEYAEQFCRPHEMRIDYRKPEGCGDDEVDEDKQEDTP